MSETDVVATSNGRYLDLLQQMETAKTALFDVCAEQVRTGLDTPDSLAARTAFTAVTIRKALRDRGVDPLPTGPKSRKGKAAE